MKSYIYITSNANNNSNNKYGMKLKHFILYIHLHIKKMKGA